MQRHAKWSLWTEPKRIHSNLGQCIYRHLHGRFVCARVCAFVFVPVSVLRMYTDPKGLAVSVLRTLHSFARTSDPIDSASSGFYLSLSGEWVQKKREKKWIKTTHSIGHWQEFSRHKQVIWWDSCARPCKCVSFHSVQRLAQFPIGIIIILIQWISCVGIALNSIPHNRAMNIYFIFCCCCHCDRCCFHSIELDM